MWLFNKMCTSKRRLEGRTAIITGANSGIGKETARDFYKRGARVILACRNIELAKEAAEDIKNNPPLGIDKDEYLNNAGEIAIYLLNLCSLKSVRDCAKSLLENETAIHILVNNAGVAYVPQEKTEDGYEVTLQTNYLGHFLLTLLLLPKMRLSSPECRIVNISSMLHHYRYAVSIFLFAEIYKSESMKMICYIVADIDFDDINLERSYGGWKAYNQSKLIGILFTKELARRLNEANIHGINVYSLHPGLIPTRILQYGDNIFSNIQYYTFILFTKIFCKNVVQGAQTTIYCSVDEKTTNETGLYYSNCGVAFPQWRARNIQYAKRLWDLSCRLLHLEPEEDLNVFLKTVSCQIAD